MNFFSSRAFLEALGDASYPNKRRRIETVEVLGQPYRVLTVGPRHRPVHEVPFLDYLEPAHGMAATRRVRHLARTAVDRFPVRAARLIELKPREALAPTLLWREFDGWDDFVTMARARQGTAFKLTARHRRKTERELGPVRFEPHVDDPAVLDALMGWKSQQYHDTHVPDILSRPEVRALFENLLASGNLTLSALYADETLLAAHAGAVHEGRFYYWLPGYDPAHRKKGTGTQLLEEMLRWSFEERHHTFDFLLGDEGYKWVFATHAVLVAPRGEVSPARQAYRGLRQGVVAQAKRHPQLYEELQTRKRRLIERGGILAWL